MTKMAGISKENLICNSDHNEYIQDYICSNSLMECDSELYLIFSDKEHIKVSSLAVYLVFPFLEHELTSLVADVISLPNHTREQFLKSLHYCFDMKSKEADLDTIEDVDTFEDITNENREDMELEIESTLVPESQLVIKSFEVDENMTNIEDILFRCEKCDSNLNQNTLISHVCDTQNSINKEDVIINHDNVNDELVLQEKTDEFEVIIEYDNCDSSEETSDQNSFIITRPTPIKNNDKPEVLAYVCDACGESFDTKTTMHHHISQGFSTCVGKLKNAYNHMKPSIQQRQNYLNDYDDEVLPCSYCDKTFRHMAPLIQHQRIHTKEKPFRCDKCNRTFSAKGNLKIHMEKHKDFTQRKFKCKVCDFGATSSVLLKYHMNAHQGVKMFQCQDCGASYMRPHSLRKHKRVGCNQDKLAQIPSQKKLNERININNKELFLVPNIIIKKNDKKVMQDDIHIQTPSEKDKDREGVNEDMVEEEVVEDDDMNLLVVPVVNHLDIHAQVVQEEIITL